MIYYIGTVPCDANYLEHHGIKGQKWGVRRFQNDDGTWTDEGKKRYGEESSSLTVIKAKTKNGVEMQLGQKPAPKFVSFVSKFSPSLKERIMNDKQFNITVDGKRIGDMEIYKEGPESLNIVWVGIDESQRGNGYASTAMSAAISYARSNGFKQVTLEVPGVSPDARHIYEKLGFKDAGKLSEDDDVWGGLTAMKLDL